MSEGGWFEDGEGFGGGRFNCEICEAREQEQGLVLNLFLNLFSVRQEIKKKIRSKIKKRFVERTHFSPVLSPRPTGGEGESCGGWG
jgi:hypothetical protein